jgi:16S rRNA (guanine966-N2)-methyltransferase
MIRIVAGKYRHRTLKFPSLETTRPTKDMVREALFSSLGEKTINASILDLFSGSGSLAIEAISRGAKKGICVDKDKISAKTIKDNVRTLGIDNISIINDDYKNVLSNLDEKFDIIFLDPPYKMDVYQEILDQVMSLNLLNDFGIIVMESDHELSLANTYSFKLKTYKYGKSYITILRS